MNDNASELAQHRLQQQHLLHNNSNSSSTTSNSTGISSSGDKLSYQMTSQLLTSATKCFSPRPTQRAKIPPHITICPPDSIDDNGVRKSHYLLDDDSDNDVFQSPVQSLSSSPTTTTPAPTSADEKHEVHSGRLYLIRQTGSCGSTSTPSSPSRSPTRSPSRSPVTYFPFRTSPPKTTPPPSPPSSPSANRKMSVFVRVYRCNLDHFAVISRDVLYTSKPVYVNMRHCRVMPGDCLGRFIVAGKCDSGNVIEFEAPDLGSLSQWLDAFQTYTPPSSPSRIMHGGGGGGGGGGNSNGGGASNSTPPIPKSPALPTLAETDEED